MISPNTPPGSEIICIDTSRGRYGPIELTKGDIYVVQQIERAITADFLVLLEGEKPVFAYDPHYGAVQLGYGLWCFRPLIIPQSLTALLTTKYRQLELT
jgi:hypothetical protein